MEPGFRDKILKSTFKPGDLIDENTRLSEGALNQISKVRSSSEIIFKLTNKQVGVTVSMLHKYFTLHELLHPPVDDVNGQGFILFVLPWSCHIACEKKISGLV